ncbi:hypothetical protein [Melittangium boletus]|uniref:hypothetical protein n=1 Tax=Melittangium boletus TaxID=83453 RepID=UPI003DA2D625
MSLPSASVPSRLSPPLRATLLALLGTVTMGSGFGASGGCGLFEGKLPTCDKACDAVAGTYTLAYPEQSPVSAECEQFKWKFPQRAEFFRDGDALGVRLDGQTEGLEYRGHYDQGGFNLYTSYDRESDAFILADGRSHPVVIGFSGNFETQPAHAQAPATASGSYTVTLKPVEGTSSTTPACYMSRKFTATR